MPTHMVLANADLPAKEAKAMLDDLSDVKGVKFALGLDSLIGLRHSPGCHT